ncbi:hypothetical protein EAI_16534 [Harpegnathos saltator]|uniref:Uncharacterized protein n=1 Tax=Harpegnathos saltator TaxID=610380 RepID=E2BAU3_HARSA|nr:hypothetical protein EAI_16534 [Harpegnathos saltator]
MGGEAGVGGWSPKQEEEREEFLRFGGREPDVRLREVSYGTPASELLRGRGDRAGSDEGVGDSDDKDSLFLSGDEEEKELGAVGGEEEEVEYPPYSVKRWEEWKAYLREQAEEWGGNRSLGNVQKARLREAFASTLRYIQELIVAGAALEDKNEKTDKRLLISETCRKELCGYMEEISAQLKTQKEKKNKREATFEKERQKWRMLLEQEREGSAEGMIALQRNLIQMDALLKLQGEKDLGSGPNRGSSLTFKIATRNQNIKSENKGTTAAGATTSTSISIITTITPTTTNSNIEANRETNGIVCLEITPYGPREKTRGTTYLRS